MSVYKRGSSWTAQVYVAQKRVQTKSGFKRKADAQKFIIETKALFLTDPTAAKANKSFLVEELLKEYELKHLPTIGVGTRTRYEIDIRLRIRPYFSRFKADSLSPKLIDQFRTDLIRANKLSYKSINECCSLLGAILGQGKRWGYFKENPYDLKPLKVPSKKYEWFESKVDVRKFLEAISGDRYEAAYRLALECGMRLGEIVGLSKLDVSFEFGRIHIHRQFCDKQKVYKPTKSNQERFIPFDPGSDLGIALKKAIADSADPEIIFVTQTGNRVYNRSLSTARYKNIIKRNNLPYVCFHGLRHTYASWFMMQHNDIWELKKLLGHSTIKMTEKYAHHATEFSKVQHISWDS